MRRWGIGTNDLYYTASAYLEEAPWYIFFAEWLNHSVCTIIPRIPFPAIKITLEDGEETTLKDYYGDLSGYWCCTVCNPLTQYLYSKIRVKHIEFPYKIAEKVFSEEIGEPDPEEFVENEYQDEEDIQERRKNKAKSYKVADQIGNLFKSLAGWTTPKHNADLD